MTELFKELLKNNYTKYGEDVDVCFKLKKNTKEKLTKNKHLDCKK